jgi:outer membrane protein OmpA-like peptidoglycan-associated protein
MTLSTKDFTMKITNTCLFASIAFAGMMSGCATTVPPELIQARSAFTASNNGLSAKLTPTELHDAWIVLDKANKEYDEHGDTTECRDYAYIANNKLALADVKARTELDRQKIAEAGKAGVVLRDSQVKNARAALSSTREQLKEERRESEKTAEQLAAEKLARESAEAKLAGAMKDLATIAAIKEDSRGLVITLSGSILFASNKYALLNTAMTKLDQVAEALKAQDSDKRMIVEGHTDSQGSDRINQPLSVNRAGAVRDYLVSRGVESDKISAVGMGSSHPLLDNKNAENRANNRRVEIIIQPAHLSAR